jgi:hypothetical protein
MATAPYQWQTLNGNKSWATRKNRHLSGDLEHRSNASMTTGSRHVVALAVVGSKG